MSVRTIGPFIILVLGKEKVLNVLWTLNVGKKETRGSWTDEKRTKNNMLRVHFARVDTQNFIENVFLKWWMNFNDI